MEATYSHEMEQMRSEMCELKSLLKEQEIVNEKLMRRAMNTSYSKERRNIRFSIIMAALAILLFCALHPHFGFPLWFFIITQLFFLFAMAASWFSLKRYASEDLLNGNLLTVAEKIVKYKRFGDNWLKFSVLPRLLAHRLFPLRHPRRKPRLCQRTCCRRSHGRRYRHGHRYNKLQAVPKTPQRNTEAD